jgi:DNA-binding XRE family transcriptional regulator
LEVILNGAQLKNWRKTLGYTQEEAAREFGVTRPTVQNWEYEITSIPFAVELASKNLLRRWKRRSEYGPVFLVHADAPLGEVQGATTEMPKLCCIKCTDNASAYQKASEFRWGIQAFNLLIIDEKNQIIWSGIDLLKELEKHRR